MLEYRTLKELTETKTICDNSKIIGTEVFMDDVRSRVELLYEKEDVYKRQTSTQLEHIRAEQSAKIQREFRTT